MGTCSLVHVHAAFFSGSASLEHATEDDAAPATRSARSPELMTREEVNLLMFRLSARMVPSIQALDGL